MIKMTNIPQYMTTKRVKSVRLTKFTEIYSLTKGKKCNIDNLTQKHLLYKQFVVWSYNGLSVTTLSDYMHNPVY